MRLQAFTKQRFPLWVLLALAVIAVLSAPLGAPRSALASPAETKNPVPVSLQLLWAQAIPAIGSGALFVDGKSSRFPTFPVEAQGKAPCFTASAKFLASLSLASAPALGPKGAAYLRQRSWPLRC